MAQFWIVGGGGVGLVVSPQRIPRRLATGCALHGASLSLVWPRESNQREGHPDIRVSLRETALPPVPLRGPSRRDVPVPSFLARRPCLASPCATPALGLLTGTVARMKLLRLIVPTLAWAPSVCARPCRLGPGPVRRPSGVDVEGDWRQGCRQRRKGAWTPLVRRPLERRWSEGSLAAQPPDPDVGCAFSLVTFSLHRQRESNSP